MVTNKSYVLAAEVYFNNDNDNKYLYDLTKIIVIYSSSILLYLLSDIDSSCIMIIDNELDI